MIYTSAAGYGTYRMTRFTADERREREERARRLVQARKSAGYPGPKAAADRWGWNLNAYKAHESGRNGFGIADARKYAAAFGVAVAWLNFAEDDDSTAGEWSVVPIMGFVGAGSEINPDFEQVPPEGLDQVELPLLIPDEMIGFEVRGDSMLPKYEDGDVVVVFREQRRSTDSMVGTNVAVRTADGRRFIKRLLFGTKPDTYNLESFNARTIEGVRIVWASAIFATLHRGQVRKLVQSSRERIDSRPSRSTGAA